MADAWDEYLRRQQPTTPRSGMGLFGSLFGGAPQGGVGGIQPNKQGMYSPSLMPMPVGPATPINYGAIRSLLNSGVLRTGTVAPPPVAAPEPVPAPEPERPDNPLARLASLFAGMLHR
jgi:hypothetical protein